MRAAVREMAQHVDLKRVFPRHLFKVLNETILLPGS
jgi:hypothetical protein